jgi:hypothetical protein
MTVKANDHMTIRTLVDDDDVTMVMMLRVVAVVVVDGGHGVRGGGGHGDGGSGDGIVHSVLKINTALCAKLVIAFAVVCGRLLFK